MARLVEEKACLVWTSLPELIEELIRPQAIKRFGGAGGGRVRRRVPVLGPRRVHHGRRAPDRRGVPDRGVNLRQFHEVRPQTCRGKESRHVRDAEDRFHRNGTRA